MAMQIIDASEYDFLRNVTADSLAFYAGIEEEPIAGAPKREFTEAERLTRVKQQLGLLQQGQRPVAHIIYHQHAAKYLPALAEKFRESSQPINPAMTLINVVSYTPYFVRFLKTPNGQGLAALQAKRMADASANNADADEVAEMNQFLGTLLLLQGAANVDADTKRRLVSKLRAWKNAFRGGLAADAGERCLALLTDDRPMRGSMDQVRRMLTKGVDSCGTVGCDQERRSQGDLLQCARCRTVRYCGADHQKRAWPTHKTTCLAPAF